MDAVQLGQLLTRYDVALSIYPNNGLVRHPELESLPKTIEHLRWMIGQSRDLVKNGRPDKALRWLGFIEGSIVQLGIFTLREVQLIDVEVSLHV